jgi:hypothetical protein
MTAGQEGDFRTSWSNGRVKPSRRQDGQVAPSEAGSVEHAAHGEARSLPAAR